ncbi:MAG TPA: hypothetical protein VFX98_14300 [Longimicrobiaceae bacterium]|nr:hypothetical protein [Longimicrobiaceae bacterium]
MHLVQILLPLRDNQGRPFPRAALERVKQELTRQFGGVTAHLRAPAEGAWREEDGGPVSTDDVVLVEVMAEHVDRFWWRLYREELAQRFRQEEVLVRSIAVESL